MTISRRTFVAAVAMAPLTLGVTLPVMANTVEYSAEKFKASTESGQTFLLAIHAQWCSTCDRQKRVINALRSQGEPYDGLTIMQADWDKERGSSLVADLNVPRRSTLIMFKGGKEVGRIVAGTGSAEIQQLIDKGF